MMRTLFATFQLKKTAYLVVTMKRNLNPLNQTLYERCYSQENSNYAGVISKEELANLVTNKNEKYVLIDVRTKPETEDVALPKIETAKNIPLQDISVAINLGNEEFKNTYGFDKPKFDDKVIVYCRSGKRSEMAQTILKQRGYSNVFNYLGSAMDWHEKRS